MTDEAMLMIREVYKQALSGELGIAEFDELDFSSMRRKMGLPTKPEPTIKEFVDNLTYGGDL
jgi:hypothetical protein